MSNANYIENSRANISQTNKTKSINFLYMAKINNERNGDTMFSINNLKALEQKEYADCDISQLVDISEIAIDKSKSAADKLYDYFKNVKNPYQFKVGDVPVKISFNTNGKKFDVALSDYLNAG